MTVDHYKGIKSLILLIWRKHKPLPVYWPITLIWDLLRPVNEFSSHLLEFSSNLYVSWHNNSVSLEYSVCRSLCLHHLFFTVHLNLPNNVLVEISTWLDFNKYRKSLALCRFTFVYCVSSTFVYNLHIPLSAIILKPLTLTFTWMPDDPNHLPQTPLQIKHTSSWHSPKESVPQQDSGAAILQKLLRKSTRNMTKNFRCPPGHKTP